MDVAPQIQTRPDPLSSENTTQKRRAGCTLTCLLFAVLVMVGWFLRPLIFNVFPPIGLFSGLWFIPLFGMLVLLFLALWWRAWLGVVALGIMALAAGFQMRLLQLPQEAIQTDSAFSVLTMNVAAKNAIKETTIGWLQTSPADVILLQESFPPGYGQFPEQIESLVAAYPEQRIQYTPLGYRGNTTLSVFPILETEGFEPESPFTRVVLTINERPIVIYNVSLATPFSELHSDDVLSLLQEYDTTRRNEQIQTLLTRLESETLPYIVAGDFNMNDLDPMYDLIAAQMTDSFRESGSGSGVTWPASSFSGLPEFLPPLFRLDYIWHSAELCTTHTEVPEGTGSDHLPVRAEFDWCEV
jgi:endonuclease/exonuclease/phosphatase (EEP) superfamily protein YafD